MVGAEARVAADAAIEAAKRSKYDFTVVKTRREIELEAVLQAFNEVGASACEIDFDCFPLKSSSVIINVLIIFFAFSDVYSLFYDLCRCRCREIDYHA